MEITEREFEVQVIEAAHLFGWLIAHFRPAQTIKGWRTPVSADGKGFPDLCMVRGERLIFAELKTEKGKVTPAQEEWLEALIFNLSRVEVYLWRPHEFDGIVDILR